MDHGSATYDWATCKAKCESEYAAKATGTNACCAFYGDEGHCALYDATPFPGGAGFSGRAAVDTWAAYIIASTGVRVKPADMATWGIPTQGGTGWDCS